MLGWMGDSRNDIVCPGPGSTGISCVLGRSGWRTMHSWNRSLLTSLLSSGDSLEYLPFWDEELPQRSSGISDWSLVSGRRPSWGPEIEWIENSLWEWIWPLSPPLFGTALQFLVPLISVGPCWSGSGVISSSGMGNSWTLYGTSSLCPGSTGPLTLSASLWQSVPAILLDLPVGSRGQSPYPQTRSDKRNYTFECIVTALMSDWWQCVCMEELLSCTRVLLSGTSPVTRGTSASSLGCSPPRGKTPAKKWLPSTVLLNTGTIAQRLNLIQVLFFPLRKVSTKKVWCHLCEISIIFYQRWQVLVDRGH